jgi:hypothetical protein
MRDYRIGADDLLEIRSSGSGNSPRTVRVNTRGRFRWSALQVGGLTAQRKPSRWSSRSLPRATCRIRR